MMLPARVVGPRVAQNQRQLCFHVFPCCSLCKSSLLPHHSSAWYLTAQCQTGLIFINPLKNDCRASAPELEGEEPALPFLNLNLTSSPGDKPNIGVKSIGSVQGSQDKEEMWLPPCSSKPLLEAALGFQREGNGQKQHGTVPRLCELGAGTGALGPKGKTVTVGTSLASLGRRADTALRLSHSTALVYGQHGVKQDQRNSLSRKRDKRKLHFQQAREKELSEMKCRGGQRGWTQTTHTSQCSRQCSGTRF